MSKITKDIESQLKFIDIPKVVNDDVYDKNIINADRLNLDFCACCGKALATSKYYFNSAFGGFAYIPLDDTVYDDTWIMWIGASCKNKLPKEYIFKNSTK